MSDKQSDDVSFDSEKTLQQEEQIRIWRMTLAVHFSNLLYSAAFWIQIGINPVCTNFVSAMYFDDISFIPC